ncbi:MAG: undecaprenyl diphosphate synthase [Phycisphaerales bacterium]|jgi:undecaprenyl diphosphate synthase
MSDTPTVQDVLPGINPARIPRHVAIIMDGNGRWAEQQGFPRAFGHRNGVRSVREVLKVADEIGIEVVTLYSFSSENWKRPSDEIEALMQLCVMYCEGEREELVGQNVRVRVIGRREGLPQEVLRALDLLQAETASCTGTTLCLAINYGSRDEIVDAARSIAESVRAGELAPGEIDVETISGRLYTAGLPDPDLLIRTAGEMRLSNYLLWQISYAEIYVTDLLWPEFGRAEFVEAIRAYASRDRRFGGISTDDETGLSPSPGESE